LIASVGGAAALAVHPADKSVNSHLSSHNDLFASGAVIGDTGTLVGVAFGTWGFGRMLGSHDASHLGLDGLRAIALSEMMVQSLKYTVRRERPDHSSGYAFPSGHSADTFALATVIARHPGFNWSLIGYAAASYVAMSRLHDNVHYLSDVVFGASVGSIAGTTVTRHGRSNYALVPLIEPRGGGLALLYTGH
jgi:membrane-associated phospholipid phosphatase